MATQNPFGPGNQATSGPSGPGMPMSLEDLQARLAAAQTKLSGMAPVNMGALSQQYGGKFSDRAGLEAFYNKLSNRSDKFAAAGKHKRASRTGQRAEPLGAARDYFNQQDSINSLQQQIAALGGNTGQTPSKPPVSGGGEASIPPNEGFPGSGNFRVSNPEPMPGMPTQPSGSSNPPPYQPPSNPIGNTGTTGIKTPSGEYSFVDYPNSQAGQMLSDVFNRATQGSIQNFNTSANRLRERLDSAGQGQRQQAINQSLSRGFGPSGQLESNLYDIGAGAQNAYAQGLNDLTNQFEQNRLAGLNTAAGAGSSMMQGTNQLNNMIYDLLNAREGRTAASQLQSQELQFKGTQAERDRALQQQLAELGAKTGIYQGSMNLGGGAQGGSQSYGIPPDLLKSLLGL